MKRFTIMVFLIISLFSTLSYAGTFYNPKPDKLKEEGKKAAEKLNKSFIYFYEMLRSAERNELAVAKKLKETFTEQMKLSLDNFKEVYRLAIKENRKIEIYNLTGKQIEIYEWMIRNSYLKNKEISMKDLTELPVINIENLIKVTAEMKIVEGDPTLFSKIRKLILRVLKVQHLGVNVSEIWEAYDGY